MARVFISYSRKDKEFVRTLSASLAGREREAWIDWKDIPLTAEWQQEIFSNIETADDFVFVVSPDSVASTNCKKEIEHAAANNKRMLPIFYRSVADDEIPQALARFQGIDFKDNDDFDAKISQLVDALDTDLVWTQAHTRLLTHAKEWERQGKDRSLLLRGKDLRDAEQWQSDAGNKAIQPTALQSQFIFASRQAATRLQRIVFASIGAAFLVTLGLAIYSFWQAHVATQERNVATARQLAAQAQVHLNQNSSGIELALLLAVEAARRLPGWESEQTLRASLRLFPKNIAALRAPGAMEEWIIDRSERWVLGSGGKTSARLWDLTDPARPWPLPHTTEGFGFPHISDDAASLITFSDGKIQLWDRQSHSLLRSIPFTPVHNNLSDAQIMPGWRAALYAVPPQVHVMPLQNGEPYTVDHPEPGTDLSLSMTLEMSPDGEHFATCGKTKAVLWRLGQPAPVVVIASPKPGSDPHILFADSHHLAVFAGTALELYDSLSGRLVDRFTLPVEPESITFDAADHIAALLENEPNDNALTVYDLRRQKTLGRVVHPAHITNIKLSPGGDRLITSDGIADSIVSKVQINEISDAGLSEVATIVERGAPAFDVTPDGERFLTHAVGPLQVWNGATGLELARIDTERGILSLGGYLVLADPGSTSEKEISIWDTRKMLGRLEPDASVMDTPEYRVAMHDAPMSPGPNLQDFIAPCGTYSCDGQKLLLVTNHFMDRVCKDTSRDVTCTSAGLAIGSDEGRLVHGPVEPEHGYGVLNQTETWTSTTFLLTLGPKTPDDSVHIIDRKTKRDLVWIPSGLLGSAGFSATGKYVAGIQKTKLTLWDSSTGRELSSHQVNYPIDQVAFSRDDGLLSVLSEKDGIEINRPKSFYVLRVSPAGALRLVLRRDDISEGDICTTGSRAWTENKDGSVLTLLDAGNGREIKRIPVGDGQSSYPSPKALFSADCTRIATRKNQVTLWDTEAGRSRLRLTSEGNVTFWVFTPDGTHLVTTEGNTAMVWDLKTGLNVARISNEESPENAGIWGLFFVGQDSQKLHLILGSTFTTSSRPATVYWRLDDLISQACNRLTRNFTREEWAAYVGSELWRKTCPNLP